MPVSNSTRTIMTRNPVRMKHLLSFRLTLEEEKEMELQKNNAEFLQRIGLHPPKRDWRGHSYKYEVYCDRCERWTMRNVLDKYTYLGKAGVRCCNLCNGRIRQKPKGHAARYREYRQIKSAALAY